jgi:hypothetical protein
MNIGVQMSLLYPDFLTYIPLDICPEEQYHPVPYVNIYICICIYIYVCIYIIYTFIYPSHHRHFPELVKITFPLKPQHLFYSCSLMVSSPHSTELFCYSVSDTVTPLLKSIRWFSIVKILWLWPPNYTTSPYFLLWLYLLLLFSSFLWLEPPYHSLNRSHKFWLKSLQIYNYFHLKSSSTK